MCDFTFMTHTFNFQNLIFFFLLAALKFKLRPLHLLGLPLGSHLQTLFCFQIGSCIFFSQDSLGLWSLTYAPGIAWNPGVSHYSWSKPGFWEMGFIVHSRSMRLVQILRWSLGAVRTEAFAQQEVPSLNLCSALRLPLRYLRAGMQGDLQLPGRHMWQDDRQMSDISLLPIFNSQAFQQELCLSHR
jgi:hypothetical protein